MRSAEDRGGGPAGRLDYQARCRVDGGRVFTLKATEGLYGGLEVVPVGWVLAKQLWDLRVGGSGVWYRHERFFERNRIFLRIDSMTPREVRIGVWLVAICLGVAWSDL